MSKQHKFKSVSNQVRAKNKFNTYLGNVYVESVAVDKMVRFASRYFIILSQDLATYEKKAIPKKRVIGAYICRLCSFITGIRYLSSAVMNRRWMTIMMADGNYLIARQTILSLVFSLAGFVILFIGLLLQFNEMRYKFTLLDFLIKWKAKTLLPLNYRYSKRLSKIINLMVQLLMKQAFWPLVISTSALLILPSVIAYFDPDSGFILMPTLLFNLCAVVWLIQFYCIVCAGFVAWSVPFFYLKYKFREIDAQLQWALGLKNMTLVSNAISQHNSTAIETKAINDVFKFVVFVLYYVGTPALIMLLNVSHAKETVDTARPICVFIVVMVYFVVFYLNLVSAQISHSAAKPRKMFYKFMLDTEISLNKRMEILEFIEKLSHSGIGFFCWDIFPMNNYRFYKYVASCGCTYFLILELYKQLN